MATTDYYSGSPSVAANESILVAVSDDADGNADSRTYPNEENGMGIRDAFSLNYIRTVPSPITNWKVSICGRAGSEIIVTSNFNEICARRGNDVQIWDYEQGTGGVPTIGCDTHLIVAIGYDIEIYRVNPVDDASAIGMDSGLLSLCQTCTINEEDDFIMNKISWSDDKSHFIISFPHYISVWKFDARTHTATLTESISVEDVYINNVALTSDFIVGASEDKKIHIWKRGSGEKLHMLCDVDEEDELDQDDIIYPLSLYCPIGNILISTSHLGGQLCVWNMNTGKLLKIHNGDYRHVDRLPDGSDVTDMAYLEKLNAFLCTTESMNVWAFPSNMRQYMMARSIQRREKLLSNAALLNHS